MIILTTAYIIHTVLRVSTGSYRFRAVSVTSSRIVFTLHEGPDDNTPNITLPHWLYLLPHWPIIFRSRTNHAGSPVSWDVANVEPNRPSGGETCSGCPHHVGRPGQHERLRGEGASLLVWRCGTVQSLYSWQNHLRYVWNYLPIDDTFVARELRRMPRSCVGDGDFLRGGLLDVCKTCGGFDMPRDIDLMFSDVFTFVIRMWLLRIQRSTL